MPSLPGPPLPISPKGTLCLLKSVRQPAVSSLGGGAARGLSARCEPLSEQPASSSAASRTGTVTLITRLDAAPRISGAVARIERVDEPAEGQTGAAGVQRDSASSATRPPSLALG